MGDQISINLSHILLGRPSKFFLLNFFFIDELHFNESHPFFPIRLIDFFLDFLEQKTIDIIFLLRPLKYLPQNMSPRKGFLKRFQSQFIIGRIQF